MSEPLPANLQRVGLPTADGLGTRSQWIDRARRAQSATAAEPRYCVSTVHTRDDIMALRSAWQRLEVLSVGTTVFQSFDLCQPWLDSFVFGEAPTHQAHILAIHDDKGVLVALVPLAHKRSGPVSLAEWIGEPIVQYGDMLMDPTCNRAVLRTVLLQAIKDWAVSSLHLRNVRADSRLAQVLDLAPFQVGATRHAAFTELPLFKSGADFFATFSKGTRKNLNRKRRGLASEGEMSFDMVPAGPEAAVLGDLALEWKKAWLADRGLSSRAFLDQRALTALTTMLEHESDTNPFQLGVLRCAGKPVAIEVSLVSREGCVAFIGSYDSAYDRWSPGLMQMEAIINHGIAHGWKAYDMLAPMTEYKARWSTAKVAVADYVLAADIWGMAYRDLFVRGLRPAMKATLMALPAWARTGLLRSSAEITA